MKKLSKSCKKKHKQRYIKKKKLSRLAKILRRRKRQQKAKLAAAASSTLLDLQRPPLEINIIELERSGYGGIGREWLPSVQFEMRPAIPLPPVQKVSLSAESVAKVRRTGYLFDPLPCSTRLPMVASAITVTAGYSPIIHQLPSLLFKVVIPEIVAQIVPALHSPTANFAPSQKSFQSWSDLPPPRRHRAGPVRGLPARLARPDVVGPADVPSSASSVPDGGLNVKQSASKNKNSGSQCNALIAKGRGSCGRARKFVNPGQVFVRLVGKGGVKGFEKVRWLARKFILQYFQWSVRVRVSRLLQGCRVEPEWGRLRPMAQLDCSYHARPARWLPILPVLARPGMRGSPTRLPSTPPGPDRKITAEPSALLYKDDDSQSEGVDYKELKLRKFDKKIVRLRRPVPLFTRLSVIRRGKRTLLNKGTAAGEGIGKNFGKQLGFLVRYSAPWCLRRLVDDRKVGVTESATPASSPPPTSDKGPGAKPAAFGNGNDDNVGKSSNAKGSRSFTPRGYFIKLSERHPSTQTSACQITAPARERKLSDLAANPPDAMRDNDRKDFEASIGRICQAMAASFACSESVGRVSARLPRTTAMEPLVFSPAAGTKLL